MLTEKFFQEELKLLEARLANTHHQFGPYLDEFSSYIKAHRSSPTVFISHCFLFFSKYLSHTRYPNRLIQQAYTIVNFDDLSYSVQKKLKEIDINIFHLARLVLQENIYTNILKKLDAATRIEDSIQTVFVKATDFYDQYAAGTIIKNMRELTAENKAEIDKLLNDFIYRLYDRQMSSSPNTYAEDFAQLVTYPYFIYAHYPNANSYNIFHLQIITNRFGSEVSYRRDITHAYFGPSSTRMFLWEYLKYLDYGQIDINVVYAKYDTDINKFLTDISTRVQEKSSESILKTMPTVDTIRYSGTVL